MLVNIAHSQYMNVICMSTVSSSDQESCLRIFRNRKNCFARVVIYGDLANLSYTQCALDKKVICVIKKSQEALICHLHSYTRQLGIEMLVTRLRLVVVLTGLYTNLSPVPREQLEVQCVAQGSQSVMVLKVEESINNPLPIIPAVTSGYDSQTLGHNCP